MQVRSYLFLIAFCLFGAFVSAQTVADLQKLKTKVGNVLALEEGVKKSKYGSIENLLLNEPGIYNEIWNRVYNSFREKDDRFLFKNLKLDFKTFQSDDSSRATLGFSYKWNYEINKKKNTDYERSEFLAKINAEGNIAFKKELNPLDLQSVKLEIGTSGFLGGTVNKSDSALVKELNKINQELATIDDEDELASSSLWNKITAAMGIRNQYHYNFSAVGGWEGSQDFTRSQFTYGAMLRFSAKSYSDKNPLSQLNILDYPFALIRFISGTDKTLNPYGAALPIVTMGIDMVNPMKDSVRNVLTGNMNPYARFRFETGFRTLLADLGKTTLHFNAAYRFFSEISPKEVVKAANLQHSSYFSFSVTASDTYFISYSYGKLPFDRTDNAIYEMGFKINL